MNGLTVTGSFSSVPDIVSWAVRSNHRAIAELGESMSDEPPTSTQLADPLVFQSNLGFVHRDPFVNVAWVVAHQILCLRQLRD